MEASISDREALRAVVRIVETHVHAIQRVETKIDTLTIRLAELERHIKEYMP